MKPVIFILFNFIFIPQLVLASSITTGDAYSKSTVTTTTDEEFVTIQNNTATAVSNTGNQTSPNSITTGDSSAVSEVNINNGDVEGSLKVEVNGEQKILKISQPGSYKLEASKSAATSQPETKQNSVKPTAALYLEKLIDFILGFFKK